MAVRQRTRAAGLWPIYGDQRPVYFAGPSSSQSPGYLASWQGLALPNTGPLLPKAVW